jgi:integrase
MARRSNGEGAITQRQDGRWQASLQVDGRRRTVYGRTRAEAAAKLAELQRQATKAGTLPDPGKRTVGDLLDAWLETVTPNLKPATVAQYTLECDKHIRPALGGVRLAKVSPDRLQRLYAGLRKSGRGRTAELVHALLRQAFGLAVLWRWLPENPCERVVRPTHQAERKALWSPNELRTFLDATYEHWLGPLWALLAYSGVRLGEALALTWADVDLATGRIVIAKTVQRIGGRWVVSEPKTRAGVRTVTLPPEAIEALRRQAERRLAAGGGALVFASEGQPLHRATVAHAMRRECDRLGLPPVTPHGLRHLHASLLLAEGLPIPAVSQRLGHANSAITMAVYAHAIGKDDSAATQAIARAIGDKNRWERG